MNAKQNMKSVSSIERQLSSVQISQRERAAALNDARIAAMFIGAIEWVGCKLQRSRAEGFAKLSPKY